MYNMHDRVAIVTGAGRQGGIGEAIARRLAQDGAHVVVGDICATAGAASGRSWLPSPGRLNPWACGAFRCAWT
jgi:NAD(P)-dependent dehydrogenase (short-subunit alcohol dehydrogenase family)